MHCAQCGSYIDDDARFCKQCGAPAADTEETRIARPQPVAPIAYHDNDDVEHVIFTARPTLIFVKLGYVLAVLGAIALTILFAMIPHLPCLASDSCLLPPETKHDPVHGHGFEDRN